MPAVSGTPRSPLTIRPGLLQNLRLMPPSSQGLRHASTDEGVLRHRACGTGPAVEQGMESHEVPHPDADGARYQRVLRLGLGVFLAIALFFLWQEHRAHLLGALPWLLLLACPLMHRLMHRRHGDHHRDARHKAHEHGGGCH